MPRLHLLGIALALASALSVVAGPHASADGGRCGDRGRPACTILRPPELGPPPGTNYAAPECIVLVGGFGSAEGDNTFDDLFRWTQEEPLDQLFRFGTDRKDRFPYDTTGPIDVSGEDLRGLVRSLTPDCRAIHLVAHSMGGAVVDRAFSMGLSRRDGVATYVALSSPHRGATLAKALRAPIAGDPLIAIETSVIARTLGQPDPTTPAAHDLALIDREHPPRPVREVAAARLRVATDAMVLRRDNVDRRAEVREYFALDEIEGHSGILRNDQVRRVLVTTIASHAIAVDHRPALERTVADLVSRGVDEQLAEIYAASSSYLLTEPTAPLTLAGAYGVVRLVQVVAQVVSDVTRALPEASSLTAPFRAVP